MGERSRLGGGGDAERETVEIVETESTDGDLLRLGCEPSDSFPLLSSSRCLLRSASFFESSSSAAPFLKNKLEFCLVVFRPRDVLLL